MNALNNLQKRNNVLKFKLLHEKLKYGNYQFNTFRNELLLVLDAYKTHKSLIKAADSVSIDKKLVITWFIEGLSGNPQFRDFYLGIKRMNELKPQNSSPEAEEVVSSEVVDVVVPEVEEVVSSEVVDVVVPEAEEAVKNYTISEFLNACTYTAEIDGEKISFISRDLDTLKQIVKSKNLPID